MAILTAVAPGSIFEGALVSWRGLVHELAAVASCGIGGIPVQNAQVDDHMGVEPLPQAPPSWLVRRAAEAVVTRRIRTAPADRVAELVQTTPDRVEYYLEVSSDHALLALYPRSDSLEIDRRIQRFGQAYPGLFNVNGTPRPHNVKKPGPFEPAFIGGVKTRSLDAVLLLGAEGFGARLRTDCFLRLEPNTSIALSRLVLQSGKRAARRFKYRINFVYMMAFGDRASAYDFSDYLENSLVRWFGMNAGASEPTKLYGEINIEREAA